MKIASQTSPRGWDKNSISNTASNETNEYTHVTKFIEENFFKAFDEDDTRIFASIAKAKSNAAANKGISDVELLRKSWRIQADRARHNGSGVHAYFQLLSISYPYGEDIQPLTVYEQAARQFYFQIYDKFDIEIVEGKVSSDDLQLVGIFDAIIKNKTTNERCLIDFKTFPDGTKKEQTKHYGLELFGKSASKFQKTALQLELYNKLGNYNIPADKQYCIQLGTDGNYTKFSMADSKIKIDVSKLNDILIKYKNQFMTTPKGRSSLISNLL